MQIKENRPVEYQPGALDDILTNYKNVTMTVTDIAKKYNVTPRSIQRLIKKYGLSRTISEANKVTAKLKDYSKNRTPDHLKIKRHHISRKIRYDIISKHPFCTLCGNTAKDCTLHIDHIDGDPSNNNINNLQVLCMLCNFGKK